MASNQTRKLNSKSVKTALSSVNSTTNLGAEFVYADSDLQQQECSKPIELLHDVGNFLHQFTEMAQHEWHLSFYFLFISLT
jgi:hypothetical protein